MVNEEKLVHFFLLYAKKICCFLLQLAKLHILWNRKLTRYRSIVRLLGAMDDDLLGWGNVGSDQDGGINLNMWIYQSLKFKVLLISYLSLILILLQQLSLGLEKCVSAVPRHFCWSVMLFGSDWSSRSHNLRPSVRQVLSNLSEAPNLHLLGSY